MHQLAALRGPRLLYLVFVVALLGAACGPAAGGGATTIRMTEFKFEPATITAKQGQPLRLTLQNAGTVVHDFVAADLEATSPKVQPGQSTNFEFTPSKTGSFRFICTEPGHEAAGMTGTLNVQ